MAAAVVSPAATASPSHGKRRAAASVEDTALPAPVTTPLEALVAASGLQRLPVDVLKIAAAFARFTWNVLSCAVPRPLVFQCGLHHEERCDARAVCITPRGSVVCVDANHHIGVCAAGRYTWHTLDPEALLTATGGTAVSRAIFVSYTGVFCVRTDGVVLVFIHRGPQCSPPSPPVLSERWVVAIRVEDARGDGIRPEILWAVDVAMSRVEIDQGFTRGLSSHATSGQCAAVACLGHGTDARAAGVLRVWQLGACGVFAADVLTLPLLDAYARWDICDAGVVQMHASSRVVLHAWSTGTELISVDLAWHRSIVGYRTTSVPYHVAYVVTSSSIHILAVVEADHCPGMPPEYRLAVVAKDVPLSTSSAEAGWAGWREVTADGHVIDVLRRYGVAHVHASGMAVLMPSVHAGCPRDIWRFG